MKEIYITVRKIYITKNERNLHYDRPCTLCYEYMDCRECMRCSCCWPIIHAHSSPC